MAMLKKWKAIFPLALGGRKSLMIDTAQLWCFEKAGAVHDFCVPIHYPIMIREGSKSAMTKNTESRIVTSHEI